MLKPTCHFFSVIIKFIDWLFRIIFAVINRLSLQPLLVLWMVWLLLPADSKTAGIITLFTVLLFTFLVYAVLATVYKVTAFVKSSAENKNGKRHQPNNAGFSGEAPPQTEYPPHEGVQGHYLPQGFAEDERTSFASPAPSAPSGYAQPSGFSSGYATPMPTASKPLYYRVAQNPRYVMAEYPDRYELYYDDNGVYKFVKANIKKQEG